ncbi:MAG TPA: hypothetical protein VM146_03680 [Steroidobacteraceae bacterium]|nr:hypothetical protein [Steroidobacteraceae bacterium]
MTHPPLHKIEKFMLALIVAQFCWLGWGLWSNPSIFTGGGVLARLMIVALILIGCVAFTLIATRSPSGWVTLMGFYLPQLPNVDAHGQTLWMFHFLPTIFWRVFTGDAWELRVNLVALLFFALCFPAWQLRRKANVAGAFPSFTGGA